MRFKLTVLQTVESTQDVARKLALSGEPEGAAIMALNQTRGRGRLGHSWISPPGKNLALSIILRPRLTPTESPLLGLLTSVAIANTLDKCGIARSELKWPNDVLVGGRKIAGILSEAVLEDGIVQHVIIGVGLNVNAQESDFPQHFMIPATSIFLCTGRERDVEETARDFLEEMHALYGRVNRDGSSFILGLWEDRWAHRSMMMVYEGVVGTAKGLDEDGALILSTPDGRLIRILSGDVFPLQPDTKGFLNNSRD